ncbi:COX15/CtaA family protein [Halobacteriales archaeon Cl-PHB]
MAATRAIRERSLGIVRRARYHHLAATTLVGTYVLMILGSYTGAIGAGLSCPDWPTCYGTAVPFLHPEIVAEAPYSALQIFAEWAHRGLAMVVGVLIIATAVTAWRSGRSRLVVGAAAVATALLPLQVLLGSLTVTEALEPSVVTAHLATASLILVALTVTTVASWLGYRAETTARP